MFLLAVFIGKTRLIDNLYIEPRSSGSEETSVSFLADVLALSFRSRRFLLLDFCYSPKFLSEVTEIEFSEFDWFRFFLVLALLLPAVAQARRHDSSRSEDFGGDRPIREFQNCQKPGRR